jgi:hypothetical protein
MKRNVFFVVAAAFALAWANQASAAIIAGYSNVGFSNPVGWASITETDHSDGTNSTKFTTGTTLPIDPLHLTSKTTLTFTSNTFSVDDADSNFAVATLTYFNGTNAFASSSVDASVTLTITDPTSASGTFTYTFSFTTSINWKADNAPDTLYFSEGTSTPISFTYNGYTYTISLLGFYLNGVEVNSITVAEKASATVTLDATITAVPNPEDPPAVPEPATCLIWSLFSGIGAIGCWRRKQAS